MEDRGWGRNLSRNLSRTSWGVEDVFGSQTRGSVRAHEEDEEALRWAALEKLPTYNRLRTSILKSYAESQKESGINNRISHKEVDVRKLDIHDRIQFIDRLFKVAEEDNERFLRKLRDRIDK
uniref:Adenosinetriphosphatase n=2 Tax=Opuntia streptacantha TaxID=393608 RepID=A0A7C9CIV9_OPUST